MRTPYTSWFFVPAAVVYGILFLIPTFASFFFSLTRWNIYTSKFIGFSNFGEFLREQNLLQGLINSAIYAVVTCGFKVVIGLLLGVLLTSRVMARGYLRAVVFFPVLVSTIGVGLTFSVLMDPTGGSINRALSMVGIQGPYWLTDPHWALLSVALVDVWKGLGLATVIYIAGIASIPQEYYEAARVDGANGWHTLRHITLRLSMPATATVIILALISGLRSFDLIWAMTRGGPGFATDTVASVIYKQYQAGFYGLSTAGNVILFLLVTAIVLPLTWFLNRLADI
jgi:raffinose/stachyose/melibiose transport system permease protein